MTDAVASVLVPADPAPHWLRRLVVAEVLVLVGPPFVLALVAAYAFAVSLTRGVDLGSVFVLAQIAVASMAMVATLHAAVVYFRRGAAGLASLSAFTFGAMHAGAVLVLAGVVAFFLRISLWPELGPFGTMLLTNLVGVPALIPYRALMRARRRAMAGAPGPSAGTTNAAWGPVLAIAVIAAALLATGPRPFDDELWKASEPGVTAYAPRLRMSHWLVGTGALRGMSRERVVEMLGPPTGSHLYGWDALYSLEPGLRPLTMFSPDLAIRFDAQGRVVDACVCTFD